MGEWELGEKETCVCVCVCVCVCGARERERKKEGARESKRETYDDKPSDHPKNITQGKLLKALRGGISNVNS